MQAKFTVVGPQVSLALADLKNSFPEYGPNSIWSPINLNGISIVLILHFPV